MNEEVKDEDMAVSISQAFELGVNAHFHLEVDFSILYSLALSTIKVSK